METDLGESFARAIATKNATALLGLLSPEVDFRAMTPGRFWEASSAAEVVNGVIFGRWFEDGDRIDAVDAIECDVVADRRRVGYRFRVTNAEGALLPSEELLTSSVPSSRMAHHFPRLPCPLTSPRPRTAAPPLSAIPDQRDVLLFCARSFSFAR